VLQHSLNREPDRARVANGIRGSAQGQAGRRGCPQNYANAAAKLVPSA
jgi:hypothetical protein